MTRIDFLPRWTDRPRLAGPTRSGAKVVLIGVLISTHSGISSFAGERSAEDPARVLGVESCVKCHAEEVRVWRATPHARTFEELHRRPEAREIAKNLGLRSVKHDGRCVDCHYTRVEASGDGGTDSRVGVDVVAGVSCESCHGAAKGWIDLHHNVAPGEGVGTGAGQTLRRVSETPAQRRDRIAASVAAGMRNPHNLYAMAQSCYRCHTAPDEELVNRGGHSAGSLDFEMVSWSQGSVRHNFVRSDGASNEASAKERLRVMFVAGMIADLEASLRATAKATEKATYGMTVAQRASRAAARLASVVSKVEDPLLDEIVTTFRGVTLKLNNREELIDAADRIAGLGHRFAAQADGDSLAPLDAFVPGPDRWK